jgi:hypothetical protein
MMIVDIREKYFLGWVERNVKPNASIRVGWALPTS